MTKKRCPLGEDCDLTIAWMAGAAKAQDQIKAQAAEIERLKAKLAMVEETMDAGFVEYERKLESLLGGAETVLEAWDSGDEASFREAIEEMRADVEAAKGEKA